MDCLGLKTVTPHLWCGGQVLDSYATFLIFRKLIKQCDEDGLEHNTMVPLHHCLTSPGGPLIFCLDGHEYAVFKCSLTSDHQYLVSVSNRIISWDVSTSEICRDIDPRVEGVMIEMALSSDNYYAVAFTNTNQIVIINVMAGSSLIVDKPLAEGENIQGVCFTGRNSIGNETDIIAVYNERGYRLFNLQGEHIGGKIFGIDFCDLLDINFSDPKNFISFHWKENADFDDARMWLYSSGWETLDSKVSYYAVEIYSTTPQHFSYYACIKRSNISYAIVFCKRNNLGTILHENVIVEKTNEIFQISKYDQYIIATTATGFILVQPTNSKYKSTWYYLPRDVRNIRIKLNVSNPTALNFEKSMFLAGVRRNLFLWDIQSQQMLRSFQAHNERIRQMLILQNDGKHIIVTSSADKTIKVWDSTKLLNIVPEVSKLSLKIIKLIVCDKANIVLTLTTNKIAVWCLKSGSLEFTLSGVTEQDSLLVDMAITLDGQSLITIESNILKVWNFSHRVVLYKVKYTLLRKL